jgi:hypothetical protein
MKTFIQCACNGVFVAICLGVLGFGFKDWSYWVICVLGNGALVLIESWIKNLRKGK